MARGQGADISPPRVRLQVSECVWAGQSGDPHEVGGRGGLWCSQPHSVRQERLCSLPSRGVTGGSFHGEKPTLAAASEQMVEGGWGVGGRREAER